MTGPWWWSGARAVARRPDLWWTAWGQLQALVPRRWWARRPPLPLPAPAWIAFRMETAYGRPDARPRSDDVVTFLEWCKESRRSPHLMR